MNNTSVHAKPITRSVPPNLVELEAGGLALGTEVGRRWWTSARHGGRAAVGLRAYSGVVTTDLLLAGRARWRAPPKGT